MSTNPFRRFLELLPSDPVRVGDITALHADGTASVELIGGAGSIIVRNPQDLAEGARVFLQGDAITGPAPNLPTITLTV